MLRQAKIERFNENVLSKYQIYNSIFLTLPFDTISNTGVMLPLFSTECKKGFSNKKTPTQIVETFFKKYHQKPSQKEKNDLLFRFIQYIERQVVLFDAIEDAAFPIVTNMDGIGTLRNIKEEAKAKDKVKELKTYLNRFKVRPVLTAHPTQFYPGAVLGIITDLDYAIEKSDLLTIKKLLAQLGKTPFFKKEKPSPYEEAVRLIWYLENVFYHSVSKIYDYIQHNILKGEPLDNQVIDLGFWPGGDRDGNPFVTTEITLKVADRLKKTILLNYYRDIRKLKRRITFPGVDRIMAELEKDLYDNVYDQKGKNKLEINGLMSKLQEIKRLIEKDHNSLFLSEIETLINKVTLFGFHFATLDIRQDSRVHLSVFESIVKETQNQKLNIFPKDYLGLSQSEQIKLLENVKGKLDPEIFKDELVNKTLGSIYAMKTIQKENGERGAHRYIISNNQSALNVMQTFAMINLCGWTKPTVDVIPLFETVPDLQGSHKVMETLYTNAAYKKHLERRGNKQTIMLGFSDGTKDGGYLMANWSIYKAKEELTKISRKYGIKVIFFDGRGGPPARGGGNTHKFYASLGPNIENEEIQITIQGQTISSNFGTLESSQYNLEQLISSGISNGVFLESEGLLSDSDRETMNRLAELSYDTYVAFKSHPKFMPYLEKMSTLTYYAKTNIGSRPSKRGKSTELNFSDLRAIPFVGSWSQLKQNVPGFYGVGSAIKQFEDAGELKKVKDLYKNSSFFRTLIGNSMMSLTKSFFNLTEYMRKDIEFGDFWEIIFNEYKLTKELLLKISGSKELMENEQAGKASIEIREKIVLPLLTIQQYGLLKIQELRDTDSNNKDIEVYEKMVTRSLFGNINAARNSA